MAGSTARDVVAGIRGRFGEVAAQLAAAGAADEALAEFVPRHRVLLIDRPAVMRPLGRVWRLGVFLLDADARPYATGSIVRAVDPGHPGHVAIATEDRREHRAAAFRGPFPRGDTVNYDAVPLDLDADTLEAASGPLFVRDGVALVRWTKAASADGSAMPLDSYLTERVDLLLHPPEGA